MIFIWVRRKVTQLLSNPLTSSSNGIQGAVTEGAGAQDSVSGTITPCSDINVVGSNTAASSTPVQQLDTIASTSLNTVSGISY